MLYFYRSVGGLTSNKNACSLARPISSLARPRVRACRAVGSAHEPRRSGGGSLQARLLRKQPEPALRRPTPGEARLGVRCQSGGHALRREAGREASEEAGIGLLFSALRTGAVFRRPLTVISTTHAGAVLLYSACVRQTHKEIAALLSRSDEKNTPQAISRLSRFLIVCMIVLRAFSLDLTTRTPPGAQLRLPAAVGAH